MSMTAMGFQPVPLSQRVPRRPKHHFLVKHQPWQIQPFFIAPVIAGETVQNILFQSRAVTDPIKNPFIGWWLEYFIWYVKLRDIEYTSLTNPPTGSGAPLYPDVEKMLLDPNWDFTTSNLYEASSRGYTFKAANSIDWVIKCLIRCVETYFRLDGEVWNAGAFGSPINLPTVSIWEDEAQHQGANWMNSLVDESAVTWDTGINVDLNSDTVITTAEIDSAMRQWQYMVYNQQTTLSFNDYLKQFGINIPLDDLHRPELLRFIREWQYPSNTVDPLTGTPSSAVSWSIAERADKDRFISEPGFLFGATVVRPKVYMTKQTDAAVQMLTNCFAWMPQLFSASPETSWKRFAGGLTPSGKDRGPLGGNATNGYWLDIKDLYLYGDQFCSYAPSTGDSSAALPTASLQKRYASGTDADALFKTAGGGVRQDGVVNLTILGTQVETSPQDQRLT